MLTAQKLGPDYQIVTELSPSEWLWKLDMIYESNPEI